MNIHRPFQESVLYVDSARLAQLYYLQGAGKTKVLGRWREVPKTYAKKQTAYTRYGSQYYVAN